MPAHSFVRNRKSERCRRRARQGRKYLDFYERSEIKSLVTYDRTSWREHQKESRLNADFSVYVVLLMLIC